MCTLTKDELQEIERLKNSDEVKLARKANRKYDPEKQRLYMLRYLHKKGSAIKAAETKSSKSHTI